MDEIDEEELRNEFLKALSALELNASSSENDDNDDDEFYYDSEDYVEDAGEVLDDSEEGETVLYEEDLYYEGDDDFDVPDAYDWPDKSVLDKLLDSLDFGDMLVGGNDTARSSAFENVLDPVGESTSFRQESPGAKKKKKKKKANPNKYPPVEDDAFEDVVQDLEVLESIYDTSTSADERFRQAMEGFRKVRTFTPLSSKILSTFFSHGHMDINRDFSPVNKDGYEVEMQVDFIYVVSSFLSSMAEKRGWYERSYFELAPKIVGGFLKYLLRNHVLPEYETDLRQAVKIAEKAKVESPRCHTFNKVMPDDFTLALSVTYLPSYYVVADLPSTANAMMDYVGVDPARKAPLRSTRFLTGTVERIEPFSNNRIDGTHEPEVSLVSIVLSIRTATVAGSASSAHSMPDSNESTVVMTAFAADFLRPGTVLHGTFYTLENGVTFARPLQAHPSFFVEIDEE
ncbi:hypothetical protein EMPS_07395 [Entomortierella parvispora]|uniref:Uncharacterized protein n=1 Tax=Entomortierella parvispora TaxID=205924 RepID=A0A9P3LYD9_9FUNG|nr:hypothetical protein EMPS_07395 [Entomortierella parvispora]